MLKKLQGVGKLTDKGIVQLIKYEVEIQKKRNKNDPHWLWWSLAPQYKQFDVSKEIYYKVNPKKKTQ